MKGSFDIEINEVNLSVEFVANENYGKVEIEELAVFAGDYDITSIVEEKILKEIEEECFNHLPERDYEPDDEVMP